MPAALGPSGALALGVGLAILAGRRLAFVWLPGASPADRMLRPAASARQPAEPASSDRAAATATLALALPLLIVRLEAGLGLLSPWLLLALLGTVALFPRDPPRGTGEGWREAGTLWPLGVGSAALAVAVAAAAWLPIWQWDATGYHLPFVDFVLQTGSLSGVPWDAPVHGSYPHGADLLFLGERLLLPDDRLLDLGQIPFGLAGMVAIACLAQRAGASRAAGLAAGALWLALPVVALQLPTNYVDVGAAAALLLTAYWVLAEPSLQSLLLGGLCGGLLIAAKPSTPPAAALLLGVLALRGIRARLGFGAAAGLAVTLAVGAESYLRNLAAHGNPIWPVSFSVGPWHFAGQHALSEMLAAGAAVPHLTGALPFRLARSWMSAVAPRPMFDMRVGGFGPLFLLLLPAAAAALWRRRLWGWLVPLAASLATADPAVARYTLAFPALCLALAASELQALRPRARAWGFRLGALGGAAGLYLALPGFTAGGPPLWAFARLSPEARLRSLGPDGSPAPLIELRRSVRRDQAIAFGRRFDLPYLLWEPDGRNHVVRVPEEIADAEVAPWLARERVGLLLAGPDEPAGRWAAAHPQTFLAVGPCGGSEPACRVYRVVGWLTSARSSSARR
ncbi:MAG: hypothetical protein ACYDCL_15885 [Myxococcales bacterium]